MKKLGLLALFVMLAALPLTIYAQEGEEIQLTGGYLITATEDWDVTEDEEGVITLTNNDVQIAIVLPPLLASTIELTDAMDAADVLISALPEQAFERGNITLQAIDDRAYATVEYESDDGETRFRAVVLEVEVSQFGFMVMEAPASQYRQSSPSAQRVMLSLKMSGAMMGEPAEPCYARATGPYKSLRLGPGYSRGEFASMPTDEDVMVVGQNMADDASLWWQLDIDGPSDKLWVTDQDIEITGDCDTVGDANTALIAPAPGSAPPPPPSSSGSGDADSPPDTGSDTPPDVAKIPRNGTWAMSMASSIAMSCTGTGTVHRPNTLVWFNVNTAVIQASSDGTMLTMTYPFGTDTFYGQDGYYQYERTEDDMYLTFRLFVHGPTSMSGEVAIAAIGVPCSGTVPVSLSYIG